ncbi:MAG: ABC transporter ATP-binding protein [Candidatus Heimdallarchaeota archaeon]|nr:ABC transporter ATP-binding protein [Candidatus Heimdallarchaeota archaeon]
MIPYVLRKIKLFGIVTLFVVIGAIAQTMIPLKIKEVLDSINTDPSSNALVSGFWIITLLGTIDYLSAVGMRYYNNKFGQQVLYDVREDIFAKLQSQEMEFYASESIGQIMARTIEETLLMNDIFTWGYRIAMLTALLFVGAFVSMWVESPLLAFAFSIIVPIMLISLYRISRNNFPIFYDTRKTYGAMNNTLAENFSGIRTVKSFGREENQIEIFKNSNQIYFQAAKKEIHVNALIQTLAIYLINISLFIVVFFGGGLVRTSIIENSTFIAFMLLIFQIARPGRFLGELSIRLQMANTAAVRLNEVMQSTTNILSPENPVPLNTDKTVLTFENVSFKYPASKVNILENVSFSIPFGQKVAILGATGSGKSTLINLIPRFFDPTEGRLLINGIDIKQYSLDELRKYIGIVHQESFLFTLTIAENIAFGNSDASEDDIENAARIAQIHENIQSFPDAYQTMVGERGVTLSGGQKQRVAIARAILTNPKILIFDDSVSAVDPETEAKIQSQIGSLDRNRTILVISQRPSSLQYVDRIILLEDGKVVQDGTHDELIAIDGPYKDFNDAIDHQIKFIDFDSVIDQKMEVN